MIPSPNLRGVHLSESGVGEPVLFVHGGLMDGSSAWTEQRSLASRFRLRFIDRFGYGLSADRPDEDRLKADTSAVAALIRGGSHVVGHSYGALICLLACAQVPSDVHSLTLVEPPAFSIARGDTHVESLISRLSVAYPAARAQSPQAAVQTFFDALGLVGTVPPSESLKRAVRSTFREMPPWQVTVPMRALVAAGRPTLVVSGGWAGGFDKPTRHDAGLAFQRVCELLSELLPAKHVTITGATHAVQFTGPAFNAQLGSFIDAVSGGSR